MRKREKAVRYGISVFLPLVRDRAGTEMTGVEFAAEIRSSHGADAKACRLADAIETHLDKLYVCQNGAVAFSMK